jgi:HTH DNA binding domain
MLRQVSLSIENPVNPFKDLALRHNSRIRVVECKDFNSHGIALVLEIAMAHTDESLLKDLRAMEGVRHAYWAASPRNGMILAMMIMDTPAYCAIARSSGAVCSSCPFNSTDCFESSWKLLVKDSNVLRKTLDMLEERGIKAETEEVSCAKHGDMLTSRQREVMLAAIQAGYFEFPRKIGLTKLAGRLSIKPSTLSEILRRGEDKITKCYAENPSSMATAQYPSGLRMNEKNGKYFSCYTAWK